MPIGKRAPKNQRTERNQEIFYMRKSGATFREIGELYSVSTNRARKIFCAASRRLEKTGRKQANLSLRAEFAVKRKLGFLKHEIEDDVRIIDLVEFKRLGLLKVGAFENMDSGVVAEIANHLEQVGL